MHTSPLGPVLDTSIEMKTFVFLLALGYVSSEKLNLAYLPPPGSQFSGGQPGDIQVPLEFPKETYSTTLRPQTGDNRGLSPEDYKPTIGIDRVPGIPVSGIVTPGSSSFSQNGPRVPTTTVSYAFTQTTTHPPTEGFETTIGPQIGGFPTTDIFNNLPSQEPGFNFDGNVAQNQPGYQQTVNQFGQPTLSPTSEPAFNNLPSQGPGLLDNGNINQFGQPALAPTSGPVSQFTGSPNGQQFIGQNRPGPQQIFNQQQPSYQQPISGNLSGSLTPAQQNFYRNQSLPGHLGIGNQPGYVPSTNSPQAFSSTSRPYGSILGDSISNIPGANLPQSGFPQQVQINGYQPGTNVQPSQIPGQQQFVDRQMINQQFPGSQLPGQVGGFENRLPSSTVAPTYTPSFPNQQISGISGTEYNDNSSGIQQYPEFQGVSRDRQSAYQPSSTVSPTFMPGIPNQDYPAGTSVLPGGGQQYPTSATPGAYSTPSYPAVQANAASSVYRPRPERPQSEADRNAVILNYDNIITPEGFAYSFDTSNGIHADESGTATDGVKAKGSYSYIGDDGKQYSVVYTADENGFRPRGDHLPTPPPVPEAIQRVIEQAQRDKEAGIIDDGSYDVDKYGHKKYQGAMGRRPQFTDKDFSNGADIPEDAVIDGKVQQTKQRFGPQVSQKRPTASTEESDFDDGNQEPGLTDEQRTVIKENKKTGQVSTQRPYEVTYTDSQDNEGGDLEGILDENQSFEEQPTNRPFVEGTSRRPVNQGVKKQYNSATNVPGSEETTFRGGDRRRPIDRIPSSQSIGTQGFSDNREPEYNNNRFINKGYSRRPVNDEDNLYENEESDDENETSSQQPSTLGPIRRPGSNVGAENVKTESQQTYDKFGRPISRIPSRRPVSNKNRLETEPELEENYNRQRDDSKKPYYKPSTYLPEEPQTVTDEYILNEYATRAPSKIRPDGVKTVNQFVPIGTRRRPSAPGLNGSAMIDKGVQYQPENNNGYIDSNVDGDLESQDHDDRRVSSGGIPSKTSSDRYEESDLEPEDFVSIQENRSGKPKFPPSNNYEGARGRPQPSKTNVNNDRTQDSGNRRFNVARPGTKFGQKINRPAYDQQSSIDNNNENRPFNSSGYQYIPPQRKFEEDGVQRFPAAGTRVTGTTARPITGRPTPSNIFYDDKNRVSSSRPFMTPNVSRIGTENDEDRDQYNEESDSQYPDSGTTPDQVYGDDEITSTGPVRYTSTTGRPIFQTSKRPQYYDQTQNVPGKQRVPQRGRPSQGSDNRYYEGTKRPLGYASSTTPMPSSRPQVSSSRPLRPGQQDQTYYTNDVNDNKAPGKGFVSSTTPFPSESPNVEGSYQQNNIGPEYQTTYRPMETIRPTSGYKDRLNAQRLPTVGPSGTSINIAPSVSKTQYQENLPSTTYRPNYTINGQLSSTARPGIQVDGYGRPISTPGSGQSIQEYLPGGQRQPSSTVRPGGVDMYGRPNRPGYGTTTEEFIPGDLNAPSSTTAPGVQVDAFGRPIRPEAATPGQYVPSSTASPSVLVDTFGRPINKPISGAIQEYGPSSQVQPSSTARPGAFDAYGRPISAPGSTPQEYTPAFASGSEPGIIGDRVNGQFLPGVPSTVQPGYQSTSVGPQGQNSVTVSPGNQFRGNQRYQPGGFTNQPGSFTNQPGSYTNQPGWSQGVSSTFRPTTERIIGEDFSGPKQQQKFDPERGYYY